MSRAYHREDPGLNPGKGEKHSVSNSNYCVDYEFQSETLHSALIHGGLYALAWPVS